MDSEEAGHDPMSVQQESKDAATEGKTLQRTESKSSAVASGAADAPGPVRLSLKERMARLKNTS